MAEWVRSELILGGQRSGKSRRAEALAQQWLAASPSHRAVLLATARALDDEMQARIARHQRERAQRGGALTLVEEPVAVPQAVRAHSAPHTLVVVDCLTLWLSNLMLAGDAEPLAEEVGSHAGQALADAVRAASGPVVLVGNEIGLGVIPLGREVRAFVDALGRLNQCLAASCERVTLMVAGLPLTLKEVQR
jgi:adenosylcobinamide kinase/adenosylcobinamide-phosphate guanylyltransferase